jgi:hypothetical protein
MAQAGTKRDGTGPLRALVTSAPYEHQRRPSTVSIVRCDSEEFSPMSEHQAQVGPERRASAGLSHEIPSQL